MSNASGSNNRSKVLFGLSAIITFLVVGILVWPSNVRKEDASGAIGAVVKHHAPQITQQDVILGGEEVKAQQKVLFTDFREDASKLRSLAANRSDANREAFARELQMRYARVASDAVQAANRINNAKVTADVEQLQALLARGLGSDEQMSVFNKQLGVVAEELNSRAAFARLGEAEQQLGHISLANEQAANRSLEDVKAALSNVDRARELGADTEYLGMMQMESRALLGVLPPDDNRVLGALPPNDNRDLGHAVELAAKQLEARAQANESMFAADEAQ